MSPPSLFSRSRHRFMLGLCLLLSVVAAIFLATRLPAAEAEEPDAIGSGTLMLRGKGVATAIPAMRLGTDMDIIVSGQIARVRVTQAFRNTSVRWMEASYLYPCPTTVPWTA